MSENQAKKLVNEFKEGLLKGERFWLSRAISLAESTRKEDRKLISELISALYPETGGSLRIGVTGTPGVGKSTFIEQLGSFLVHAGYKVAVLTVDPSSRNTGGSLLGDKTRMDRLSSMDNAFIRSTATGGSLGGVAGNTRNAVLLCEAAGYDVVFIETVGVGQSETLVNDLADLVILLTVTNMGDTIQAIKKGVLEIADLILINKSEGKRNKEALTLKKELDSLKNLIPRDKLRSEAPEILTISSLENTGIEECWQLMISKFEKEKRNGKFESRRKDQQIFLFEALLKEQILVKVLEKEQFKRKKEEQRSKVLKGKVSIEEAIRQLLDNFSDKQ